MIIYIHTFPAWNTYIPCVEWSWHPCRRPWKGPFGLWSWPGAVRRTADRWPAMSRGPSCRGQLAVRRTVSCMRWFPPTLRACEGDTNGIGMGLMRLSIECLSHVPPPIPRTRCVKCESLHIKKWLASFHWRCQSLMWLRGAPIYQHFKVFTWKICIRGESIWHEMYVHVTQGCVEIHHLSDRAMTHLVRGIGSGEFNW